jgi:hypothetical protein
MPKKEEVHMVYRQYFLNHTTESLDGNTPKELIEMLSKLPVPEAAKLHIEPYDVYGSSSVHIYFQWLEPEAEEEKAKRLKNEAWREALDRKQYLELKKKFEVS